MPGSPGVSEAFVWPDLKAAPERPESAEALRQQAVAAGREEGYAQGLEEGRTAARAELDTLRQRLQESVTGFDAALAGMRSQRSDELARLVHSLCRKVLGWELTTNVELLEEVVAEGMSRLEAEAGEPDVYLNPDDHAVIVASYHGNLPLHADPQVPPCGVSVRLPAQAADFDPADMVGRLFAAVRDDLAC